MTLAASLRAEMALRRSREAEFGRLPQAQWNVLTDLALARIENRRVQVSAACIAAGVPGTTALQHIHRLEDGGLIERAADADDGRRFWLSITDLGFESVNAAFGFAPLALARVA